MTAYRPSRRIRLLQLWKRLWRETPEQMEKTRLKATEAAQNTYRQRNQKLAAYVQEWPDTLTNPQLKERCLIRAEEFGFKPRSLKIKLKRLGLITFDPGRKLWINDTKLSDCQTKQATPNGGA
jgi:hypothetical protein